MTENARFDDSGGNHAAHHRASYSRTGHILTSEVKTRYGRLRTQAAGEKAPWACLQAVDAAVHGTHVRHGGQRRRGFPLNRHGCESGKMPRELRPETWVPELVELRILDRDKRIFRKYVLDISGCKSRPTEQTWIKASRDSNHAVGRRRRAIARLGHCPHQTGLRFPMNASIPSCASRLVRLVTITSAAYAYASASGSSA